MRAGTGWVAAVFAGALGVAACGGGSTTMQASPALDEHDGPDAACAECKVTGGGQVMVGGQTVQLSVEAIPESGPGAGPGFGGAGVAAKGKVQVHPLPGGAQSVGDVDTILSCTRTDGVLTATFSGSFGGGRFTGTVTDRGEPAVDDTIEVTGTLALGPVPVANGNLQVHELDACRAPCDEGLCWCADTQQCEPCDPTNHDPPPYVPPEAPPPESEPVPPPLQP